MRLELREVGRDRLRAGVKNFREKGSSDASFGDLRIASVQSSECRIAAQKESNVPDDVARGTEREGFERVVTDHAGVHHREQSGAAHRTDERLSPS